MLDMMGKLKTYEIHFWTQMAFEVLIGAIERRGNDSDQYPASIQLRLKYVPLSPSTTELPENERSARGGGVRKVSHRAANKIN